MITATASAQQPQAAEQALNSGPAGDLASGPPPVWQADSATATPSVTQAQAAESLTNSQLAELPASSGQGQITADIVNGLIADGLAQPLNRSQSLVLVTDVVGDQIVTYYLKRIVPIPDSWERDWGSWGESIEMPYYVITAQGTRPLSQQELRSYANIEAIVADHRSGAAFALRASHFEGIVAAERWSEIATGGTFVLHLIPLGGAADYATQGNRKDAAISLAGDAAWFLGGPLAKAAHSSAKMASLGVTTSRTLVASAAIQTSIGVYSVGEGVYAIYRGDHFGATGYFGDAVLRLFGATASFKNAATATAKAQAAAPVMGLGFFGDLAKQATRNADSNIVVLGKTLQDGVGYIKVAAHYRATYFKLDNWRELSGKLSRGELWKINEAFLDQQLKAGKQFIFSHDPLKATDFFADEVAYLKQFGYTFVKDGWVWKAVKP